MWWLDTTYGGHGPRTGNLSKRVDELIKHFTRIEVAGRKTPGIDDDRIAFLELAVEDRHGQRVLDAPLDHPLEWPGPEGWVITFVRD